MFELENERTELLKKLRMIWNENSMPICGTFCSPWRRQILPLCARKWTIRCP